MPKAAEEWADGRSFDNKNLLSPGTARYREHQMARGAWYDKNNPPDKPWEQQPLETDQAYRAFTAYRTMLVGQRSVAHAARALGKSKATTHFRVWAQQWGWVDRAKHYDAYIEATTLDLLRDARVSIAAQHINIAQLMLGKVRQRIEGMSPAELDPADIVRWVEVGVKIERLSHDMQTELLGVAQTTRADLTIQVQDDLHEYAEVIREMVRGRGVHGLVFEDGTDGEMDTPQALPEAIDVPFTAGS